jgi:MFS family permease
MSSAVRPVVLLGTVQVTLIATITIITVALPAIQRDLRTDGPELVLVSSGYGMSFGGLLLLGGQLADSFGGRRTFVAGMVIFGLASAAGGLAPGLDVLLIARFAEGAGAALAAPAAMALLSMVLPDPLRRRRALAVWGVLSSSGAIAGTVLSGALTTWIPWRWVFAVPAAMAAVAVVAAPRVLPGGPAPLPGRTDWPGAVLATSGLTALIYGLQRSGWAALAGVGLLGVFCLAERRSLAPLMPLPFLRRRAVPLAAVMVCAAAMATAFFMLSLYLQQVRGLSPLQTSTAFLLPIPAVATSGPLAARLIPRLGARPILATGLLTAAGGLVLISFLGVPYAGLLIFPFGTGLAFSAAMVAAMQGVAQEQAGLAGALVNTAMETGPPLGLSVLAWIGTAYSHHPVTGFPFALRTAAVLLLVTAVSTMISRHAYQPEEKEQ